MFRPGETGTAYVTQRPRHGLLAYYAVYRPTVFHHNRRIVNISLAFRNQSYRMSTLHDPLLT